MFGVEFLAVRVQGLRGLQIVWSCGQAVAWNF